MTQALSALSVEMADDLLVYDVILCPCLHPRYSIILRDFEGLAGNSHTLQVTLVPLQTLPARRWNKAVVCHVDAGDIMRTCVGLPGAQSRGECCLGKVAIGTVLDQDHHCGFEDPRC